MMIFVTLFQTAQNGYGAHLVGFIDHDFLETTLQSLVLFKIFLIFIQSGGANRAQFTAGKGRLEDIGGIHGPLPFSSPDKSMDLIDKQYDLAVALCHFVDNGFQTFLKLAFILRPGHQRAHVKRKYLFGPQIFRHITAHDTLGQTFGDGGFARSRLTDKHGVVFSPSRQYLEHTAYLLIAAYHRIELTRTRTLIKIDSVFTQSIVSVLRALIRRFLSFAQFVDRSIEFLFAQPCVLEQSGGR